MGTIVMSATDVINAADKLIEHIRSVRKQRDDASIKGAMQPRKFLWFKAKERTEEEAIDWLDRNYNDLFSGWRSVYAYNDLSKVKALRKLAEHGDPVTLNQDDVGVLFGD
jgi:hypothetical protein